MANRSEFAVAHNGLKSKQARKNLEIVFSWSHELRIDLAVLVLFNLAYHDRTWLENIKNIK